MTPRMRQTAVQHVTLVLSLLLAAAAHAAQCRYAATTAEGGAHAELAAQGPCGELHGQDGFRISRDHLRRLRFRAGLAEVHVDDKVFYVDRSGRAVRVHRFEDGADYFSEGLARTLAGGKFGYIDRQLRVVVKPEYDFAFPFADGRALVCTGCVEFAEGEYRVVRGGNWGVIDRKGALLVPVRYSREELARLQGKGRGKDDSPPR